MEVVEHSAGPNTGSETEVREAPLHLSHVVSMQVLGPVRKLPVALVREAAIVAKRLRIVLV